jgi:3',5'-cyclic AMP phosphodiesterase CpdA
VSEATTGEPVRILWGGASAGLPPGWRLVEPASADSLILDGLPWVTGTVDAAYIGPALNRVPSWQVSNVLEEFRRVLRPGGWLRVRIRDLDAAVRAYVDGHPGFFWSEDGDDPAAALADHLLDWGEGRSLFTPSILVGLLERAGLTDVAATAAGETGSGDLRLTEPDRDAARNRCVEGRRPADAATSFGPEPAQVHLSWAGDGGRSVAITWCGPASAVASVRARRCGTTPFKTWPAIGRETIDGPAAPTVFHVLADANDLAAGACYEYEVVHEVDGGTWTSPRANFCAPPTEPDDAVSFGFLADTGVADRPDGLCDGTRRVLDELADLRPDLVLVGGDLAYRSSDTRWRTAGDGVRAWFDQLAPLATKHPVLLQFGNHEVVLHERYRDWAPFLTQPKGFDDGRCYSLHAGCCHVVGFWAPTASIDPAAVAWLEADLAAARAGGARWIVVFQHQPLFAHGTSHPADPAVRAALAPTLERHRVDLHLSAHDQSFERTFPVREAARAVVVASSNRDRYRQGDGVLYAKVGPGGKRSDRGLDFSRFAERRPAYGAAAVDSRHHYAMVHAEPDGMRVTTYGVAGAEAPLEVVDRFEIIADAVDRWSSPRSRSAAPGPS